ncbi:MAG: molybdopterin-dependent oxidoreductase [Armatimonadota bacterium]|nr:molybdopterin-dependent oxidoreductase [Armatimonadota bacterium]
MSKNKPTESILSEIVCAKCSRRKFLQVAGLATAATALGGMPIVGQKLRTISAAHAEELASGAPKWIYTCCNMCGGQSGIKVLVENGIVKKIEPNDFNPIGVANISTDFAKEKSRGARMCPKGNSAVKSLYDPDRLKTPVRRVGERGSGKWEPITWDEAISEVATRLGEIKQKYGPQALVWFSEDHSFTHVQVDFCTAYGTPNYHNHSNLCDVARKLGFKLVMGDDRPLADFQNSKYTLLFGWNPLGATKWALLPAIINRGRENGMKLVVVDPVFSATAAKADEWVPIRPGADGAMALGMGHVIVTEKLYDKAFIDEWVVGFDEYAEYVKDKTPEWAEKITSVPADTIRRIARELAATKPAVVDAWSGPGHHTNATQGTRAIASLPALLGQYDKPGTMVIPDKKGGKHRSDVAGWDTTNAKGARVDGLGTKYPFGHKSGIYVEARDAMISGKPYQPKAAVFVFQNFVMSVPNGAKNREAVKNMDFVLCVDTHMSETAQMADIVVPGSHALERYDLNSNWVTFPALALRQPAVKSWVGGMPEYEFVMAVARKMGFPGFDISYEELLDAELKGGIKIGLADLKALPGATWIGGETKYEKYAAEIKLPDGAVTSDKGVIKDASGKQVGMKKGDKSVRGFFTPSGKIELYAKKFAEKGFDANPAYTDPEVMPGEGYDLYLVAWKQAEHTHTRTFNNAWLMEMKPDNPLLMNSVTGKKLGIKDGDEVWIESAYAKAKSRVQFTEGIHPEVVGLQHGYGHSALGKIAKGKGTDDGQFCAGKAELASGQAITKEIAVKVYKA